jgi:hypothetical protein
MIFTNVEAGRPWQQSIAAFRKLVRAIFPEPKTGNNFSSCQLSSV